MGSADCKGDSVAGGEGEGEGEATTVCDGEGDALPVPPPPRSIPLLGEPEEEGDADPLADGDALVEAEREPPPGDALALEEAELQALNAGDAVAERVAALSEAVATALALALALGCVGENDAAALALGEPVGASGVGEAVVHADGCSEGVGVDSALALARALAEPNAGLDDGEGNAEAEPEPAPLLADALPVAPGLAELLAACELVAAGESEERREGVGGALCVASALAERSSEGVSCGDALVGAEALLPALLLDAADALAAALSVAARGVSEKEIVADEGSEADALEWPLLLAEVEASALLLAAPEGVAGGDSLLPARPDGVGAALESVGACEAEARALALSDLIGVQVALGGALAEPKGALGDAAGERDEKSEREKTPEADGERAALGEAAEDCDTEALPPVEGEGGGDRVAGALAVASAGGEAEADADAAPGVPVPGCGEAVAAPTGEPVALSVALPLPPVGVPLALALALNEAARAGEALGSGDCEAGGEGLVHALADGHAETLTEASSEEEGGAERLALSDPPEVELGVGDASALGDAVADGEGDFDGVARAEGEAGCEAVGRGDSVGVGDATSVIEPVMESLAQGEGDGEPCALLADGEGHGVADCEGAGEPLALSDAAGVALRAGERDALGHALPAALRVPLPPVALLLPLSDGSGELLEQPLALSEGEAAGDDEAQGVGEREADADAVGVGEGDLLPAVSVTVAVALPRADREVVPEALHEAVLHELALAPRGSEGDEQALGDGERLSAGEPLGVPGGEALRHAEGEGAGALGEPDAQPLHALLALALEEGEGSCGERVGALLPDGLPLPPGREAEGVKLLALLLLWEGEPAAGEGEAAPAGDAVPVRDASSDAEKDPLLDAAGDCEAARVADAETEGEWITLAEALRLTVSAALPEAKLEAEGVALPAPGVAVPGLAEALPLPAALADAAAELEAQREGAPEALPAGVRVAAALRLPLCEGVEEPAPAPTPLPLGDADGVARLAEASAEPDGECDALGVSRSAAPSEGVCAAEAVRRAEALGEADAARESDALCEGAAGEEVGACDCCALREGAAEVLAQGVAGGDAEKLALDEPAAEGEVSAGGEGVGTPEPLPRGADAQAVAVALGGGE